MKDKIKILVIVGVVISVIFRFYQINNTPNGLYLDEVDVGYQAYSFLKTGRDYFGNPLPVNFHSFGDWRVPAQIYLTVPSIALFGLNAFAVRLPVVITGIVGIYLVFKLVDSLSSDKIAAYLSALFLAFVPWHFHYSRLAFEVILMLDFILMGTIYFIKDHKSNKKPYLSILFFALSAWTYSTAKVFTPLLLISLILVNIFNTKKFEIKKNVILFCIFLLLTSPIYISNLVGEGSLRFREISILSGDNTAQQVDLLRHRSSVSVISMGELGVTPGFLEKLFYNKPILWLTQFIDNYLASFSTEFLFTKGDLNPRHSPPVFGMLYRLDALLILMGLVYLYNNKKEKNIYMFVLIWLLLAPISSALTKTGGGHASRLILMLIPLIILIAFGVRFLLDYSKNKYLRHGFLMYILLWSMSISYFLFYYFRVYKVESVYYFNHGFDKVSTLIQENKNDYEVIIADAGNESFLLAYLFYNKIEPEVFQDMHPLNYEEIVRGGAGYKFDNIYFLSPGNRDWINILKEDINESSFMVIPAGSVNNNILDFIHSEKSLNLRDKIFYPDGSINSYIVEKIIIQN